ncbi:hypothetical protein C6N75_00575 [Streptomyces solincola]|uniref:Lipoprotein n=2 Tax=Streptomyces solincola TaxID=2100817 RepID=A0A2S9Q389_9ACTN|nr:hypothetical protein C6N75_00575 [Streptomyces solincola]
MISAMTKGWGKVAAVLLAAVTMAGTAACGGDAGAESKPKATASAAKKPAEPVKAQWDKAMEWWATHDIGCVNGSAVDADREGCAVRVQDYVDDVRKIRKAMNADPAAPKGFYSDAYAIIDRLESYASTPSGEGDTEGWLDARPLIWAQGEALDEWIAAHPLQ